jgi:hypothetical protein
MDGEDGKVRPAAEQSGGGGSAASAVALLCEGTGAATPLHLVWDIVHHGYEHVGVWGKQTMAPEERRNAGRKPSVEDRGRPPDCPASSRPCVRACVDAPMACAELMACAGLGTRC